MIYASHGLVKKRSFNKICHMHLLDYQLFEKHLESKKERYVSIEESIHERGDAFTIDDSIYAAMDAALLLRKYGHNVSLFINAYYIENNINYWFVVLNCLMDLYENMEISLCGETYRFSNLKEKLAIRTIIKNTLSLLDTEEDRYSHLNKIFEIDARNYEVPRYLRTITKSDLLYLISKGVDIENHGWTHKQFACQSMNLIDSEIIKNKAWIRENLQIDSRYYAVPYGERFPPNNYNIAHLRYWLTLLRSESPGSIGNRIYNRLNFEIGP